MSSARDIPRVTTTDSKEDGGCGGEDCSGVAEGGGAAGGVCLGECAASSRLAQVLSQSPQFRCANRGGGAIGANGSAACARRRQAVTRPPGEDGGGGFFSPPAQKRRALLDRGVFLGGKKE